MLLHSFKLKHLKRSEGNQLGCCLSAFISDPVYTVPDHLHPQTTWEDIWHHFLKGHGHSIKVPKDYNFTLHFKLYLLWGFISVVHMQKKIFTLLTHALK